MFQEEVTHIIAAYTHEEMISHLKRIPEASASEENLSGGKYEL